MCLFYLFILFMVKEYRAQLEVNMIIDYLLQKKELENEE